MKQSKMHSRGQSESNMYTSMTDIGVSGYNTIISKELKDKITDSKNNWKIRTEAIDEIVVLIENYLKEDSQMIVD